MAEQTVELAPGESKEVSFETIPHEARAYTVNVDGLSGTFTALTPEVVDGRFVIAYAYWEGLPSWIQILPGNEWSANTAILTRWKVENTGNVAAQFRVEFMGQSSTILLNPGESDFVELTVNTGDPGDYSYTLNLYANDILVDSFTIAVATVRIKEPEEPEFQLLDHFNVWPSLEHRAGDYADVQMAQSFRAGYSYTTSSIKLAIRRLYHYPGATFTVVIMEADDDWVPIKGRVVSFGQIPANDVAYFPDPDVFLVSPTWTEIPISAGNIVAGRKYTIEAWGIPYNWMGYYPAQIEGKALKMVTDGWASYVGGLAPFNFLFEIYGKV